MNWREHCHGLELSAFPYRRPVEGRFRDIDARRHVNNIAVMEIMSEARTHFIYGFFASHSRPPGMFFVVGQQAVYYAGEAHFPGDIEVGLGLFELGRATFRVGMALFNEGRCTAIAEGVIVCTQGRRAASLPDGFADWAEGFMLAEGALPRQLQPVG